MKLLLVLSSYLFFFTLWSSDTFACSCMRPDSTAMEVEKSDWVFSWEVSDIKNESFQDWFMWESNRKTVTFTGIKSYKWFEESQEVIVTTSWDSASCGYNFERWKEYLVYATESEKWNMVVSLCSRTSLLTDANDDISVLNGNPIVDGERSVENDLWENIVASNNPWVIAVQDDVIETPVAKRNNFMILILFLSILLPTIFVIFFLNQKADVEKVEKIEE